MVRPISVRENAARVDQMNLLYKLDGRDKKTNPRHGTFTGLGEEIQIRNRVNKEREITEKWNKLLADQ